MKIVMIFAVMLYSIGIMAGYLLEKIDYNNGSCKCGGKWIYFDTDSQGGHGYHCSNCGKVIWISYHSIEKCHADSKTTR